MRGRRASVASWCLAVLAALALATGAVMTYADHTLFRSAPFADRVGAALREAPVRTAAARRLTDAVIAVAPDLTAVRPLVELASGAVVGTPAFRSLVRRAAFEAHHGAFDQERRRVSFRIRDAGVLVADAVRRLRPQVADAVPASVVVRVARIEGGVNGAMLRLAEIADDARGARPFVLVAALLL